MKNTASNKLFLISLFCLALSCNRVEVEEPLSAEGRCFTARTEQPTKTQLGGDLSVLWQQGDMLSIFCGNGVNACYKVSEGVGESTGRFEPTGSSSGDASVQLAGNLAYYPYGENVIANSDGTLNVELPKTQSYASGGFARGVNPMVAVTSGTEEDTFVFKNICAIFKVSLTGSDCIKTLEFSGNDNEKVCGKASLKAEYGKEPVLSFQSDAGTVLVLDCGEGVQLTSSPREFCFVVPAGTYAKGFKVKAVSTSGEYMRMTVSQAVTLKRATVKGSPSKKFVAKFDYDGNTALEAYAVENFDLDGDGVVSKSEALKVTSIDLTGVPVTSLAGLEYFSNLRNLNRLGRVYDASTDSWTDEGAVKLTGTVDLSSFAKLESVSLECNEITDVILPQSQNLIVADFRINRIGSIDLSKCPNLLRVDMYYNKLSSIDLSATTKIERLDVGSNSNLTALDVSMLKSLKYLWCYDCKLESLDLSNNTELYLISSFNNCLKSIKLPKNAEIWSLNVSYNEDLVLIDLTGVSKVVDFNAYGCTSLKYIVVDEGSSIGGVYPTRDDSSVPSQAEIIVGGLFKITPNSVDVNPAGDIFEITSETLSGSHVSSTPDWVDAVSTKVDGIKTLFSFQAEKNETGSTRTGQIVICSEAGQCQAVSVSQEPYNKQEQPDWREADFYHRSLVMRFTATWCVFCPYMAEAINMAKEELPDKIEAISMHSSGELSYPPVDIMHNRFGIQGLPTGVVDCRRRVANQSRAANTANLIIDAVKETEANYSPATGISFTSTVSGSKLDVKVSLYSHVAEKFKVAVVILEDNINEEQEGEDAGYLHHDVPRMCLSGDMNGNEISINTKNTVSELSFSGTIPSSCNKENLRVLVYVQRRYGSQSRVAESGYGDWYVDNCLSADVGKAANLVLGKDGSVTVIIGGNEGIGTGDDIEL